MSSSLASKSSESRQNGVPNRSHRSPERPRGGKSKRTLIESACAACQKRKSRCDGQRPVCSRCQTLHTECGYNTEQGESRWSALRRRNRILERERDEARDLIAQMRSRPESEAQEIYNRIRTDTHTSDLRASLREANSTITEGTSQQQPRRQRQIQQDQQHEDNHRVPQLQQQLQQPQQQLQPQQYLQQQQRQQHQSQQPQHQMPRQLSQQQDPSAFFQPGYSTTGSTYQLPPLRSIVRVPTASSITTEQQPLQQPFSSLKPRTMSQASALSIGSHTSLSSSDSYSRQSLSPRTNQPQE